MKHVVILHNIRSVYNVGAIFRTADAIGISKIYLSGYTPAPLDRFGRVRKDIAKSALGAEKTVAWGGEKEVLPLLERIKKEGFTLVAIEQDKKSVDYKKIKEKFPKANFAFVLGSETEGLAQEILAQCDAVAEIQMNGKKESLNVSVAAGIVLFRILD